MLNHRLSRLHPLEGFETACPHIDGITNGHSLNIRLCIDLTGQVMRSGRSYRDAALRGSLARSRIGIDEVGCRDSDRR